MQTNTHTHIHRCNVCDIHQIYIKYKVFTYNYKLYNSHNYNSLYNLYKLYEPLMYVMYSISLPPDHSGQNNQVIDVVII